MVQKAVEPGKTDSSNADMILIVSERKDPQVTEPGYTVTIDPSLEAFAAVDSTTIVCCRVGVSDQICRRQESPGNPSRIHTTSYSSAFSGQGSAGSIWCLE